MLASVVLNLPTAATPRPLFNQSFNQPFKSALRYTGAMSTPAVRIRTPEGELVDVAPGGIIGRSHGAALRLDHPLVSEAHALVSLRGRKLKLLTLRGSMEVDGKRLPEIVLEAGQRILLAQGVAIEVERVELPSYVLALTGFGVEPEELSAAVYSIVARPPPGLSELVVGFQAAAPAHVYSTTEGWRIRLRDQPPQAVVAGASWDIDGARVGALELPIGSAGSKSTVFAGRIYAPLRVVARFETVHLETAGQPTLVIIGVPARILTELCVIGAPVAWEVVANEIWRDETDGRALRQNWDRNLRSLRVKLRQGGLRDDLVRPDGKGNVELFLQPGDTVVNET